MFYQKEDVKLKVESVPSVDLRCKICDWEISNHKKGCSTKYMFEPRNEKKDGEYLWLVNYFHKYGDNSIWGKWIQDSLDMKVTFSDTKSSSEETVWVTDTCGYE